MGEESGSLEMRCAGTNAARDLLEIINSEGERFEGTEGEASFWEKLFSEIVENVEIQPEVVEVVPMTKEECLSFERQEMKFGKYKGKEIGHVAASDMKYLLYIDELPDFRKDLKRYLASDYMQMQQGELFEDGEFI